MLTDPAARKRDDALTEINSILTDEVLPAVLHEALQTFWRFIDNQDDLKVGTKRNYVRYARILLRTAMVHPSDWTVKTVLEILQSMKHKPDGSDYSAQYRNMMRVVVRAILSAFGLRDLRSQCDDVDTDAGTQMRIQRIPKPVERFDIVKINEQHMKAVVSQMSSDRVRTLFWVLWDTGARPDDLRMMTLGDIDSDADGTGVTLWVPADTKTGRRPIRPRYSLAMLRKYLAEHPYATRNQDGSYRSPDVALFVDTRGRAWRSTRAISAHIRDSVKKVLELERDPEWPYPRLPKVVTCQALRINAVNRDMEEGVSIETNAIHHGHSVSVMMDVYRRRDRKALVVKEIDALAGIVHEAASSRDEWHACPTCHIQNPPGGSFCINCGAPVTSEAMLKKEEETAKRERRIAQMVLDMLLKESRERVTQS